MSVFSVLLSSRSSRNPGSPWRQLLSAVLYLGSPRGSPGRLLGDIYTHRVQMFCLCLTITEVREGLQFHGGSWASNAADLLQQPGLFFSIGLFSGLNFSSVAKCERAARDAPVTVSGPALFGFFLVLFFFYIWWFIYFIKKKLNKYLQMPCNYLKKSFCMDHTCKASFHIQRNSTFVKIINGRFFQSPEITSRNIFNRRLQFGWMNRYLRLNFWGRVSSRIAFSLSISGPYLTVRHKSPQKLVFWRRLLGAFTAWISGSSLLTLGRPDWAWPWAAHFKGPHFSHSERIKEHNNVPRNGNSAEKPLGGGSVLPDRQELRLER